MEGEKFQIFAINCTHLGCPVRWFQESHLFMCPCHGGAFYEDGSHASGPPPRGLYEYEYKIEQDRLWVRGGWAPALSAAVRLFNKKEAKNQKTKVHKSAAPKDPRLDSWTPPQLG